MEPITLPNAAVAAIAWLGCFFAAANAQCEDPYVEGMTAIPDLGSGLYQGFPGGLYPGGENKIPADHLVVGFDRSRNAIKPLNAAGDVDLDHGKVVMASMGMSSAATEFQFLLELADNDSDLNQKLVLVNGAQGGKTANEWSDPDEEAWTTFQQRLDNAGVTAEQLQVVWLKVVARTFELQVGFPDGPLKTTMLLRESVRNLKAKYPSVKLLFVSCRTYGGYAVTGLNPEPFAYEHGFSVKWLIENQIMGDPELAFFEPSAAAPWLAWGPYLWANGLGEDEVLGGVGGRSDGLEYECDDFREDDRTHPSEPQGATKIGQLVLDWFKTAELTAPWVRQASVYVDPGAGGDDGESLDVGSRDVPMLDFELCPHAVSEPVQLLSIDLKARGDGNDAADIEAVQLLLDTNADGQLDGGDLMLASGKFAADDGGLTLDLGVPLDLTSGAPAKFLVVYQIGEDLERALQAALPFVLLIPLIILRRRRWFLRSLTLCLLVVIVAYACSSGGSSSNRNNKTTSTTLESSFAVDMTGINVKSPSNSEVVELGEFPLPSRVIVVEQTVEK